MGRIPARGNGELQVGLGIEQSTLRQFVPKSETSSKFSFARSVDPWSLVLAPNEYKISYRWRE
jgi:hypothetical protein